MKININIGKPIEKWGRKAMGLRTSAVYDSQVATFMSVFFLGDRISVAYFYVLLEVLSVVKHCKNCDQLNFNFNCDFCDECQSRFRTIIAQYLAKYPEATILDLVSNTEVPSVVVVKWVNQGRIAYANSEEIRSFMWWEQSNRR